MGDAAWTYRGRWALVTGASAGIGAAFARALASRGMNLVLAARRADRLREVADEAASAYRVRTLVLTADLAHPGAAETLWKQASAGRAIDLLVNNAGFGLKAPFAELPLERQVEMVRLNCIALLELTHHAVHDMRGRGGGIVNVASVAGYQPIPTMAVYAAGKAFVISLSEAVAQEVKEEGIRVVTLNPGPVKTEFQQVAGTQVNGKTAGLRTAEEVVEAGLRALEGGRTTVTPGLFNQVSTYVVRVAPRGLVVRAAKLVMNRLR
jgi:short-subunit dehydrogenase